MFASPWWVFHSWTLWKLLVRSYLVDAKQMMKWAVGAVARGITWILAGWLGMEAIAAETNGLMLAEALGAIVLVGISVYNSVKGRKTLQNQLPPIDWRKEN